MATIQDIIAQAQQQAASQQQVDALVNTQQNISADGYMNPRSYANSLGRKFKFESSKRGALLEPGYFNDVLFSQSELAPAQRDILRQLLMMNQAGNIYGRVDDFRNRAMSSAEKQGSRNARNIGSGYGKGMGDALRLDASNRGTSMANNFMRDQLSGEGRMRTASGLLGQINSYNPMGYNMFMQNVGTKPQEQRGTSGLNTLLGIASTVAPYYAAGMFGGGGGGGGGGGVGAPANTGQGWA
jgi:hypothetical protein